MNGSARKTRSKFGVLHGRRAAQTRRKGGRVGGDSAYSLSRERGECEGRRGTTCHAMKRGDSSLCNIETDRRLIYQVNVALWISRPAVDPWYDGSSLGLS